MDQMGLADLNQEIADLRQAPAVPARRLGQQLKGRRDFLREQVRDYVEQQFLLNADVSGKRLREAFAQGKTVKCGAPKFSADPKEIVYKMAKKLGTLHSRRKRFLSAGN